VPRNLVMLPPKKTLRSIFQSEEAAIRYLAERGVFVKPSKCGACDSTTFRRTKKLWRCCNDACGVAISITSESFFFIHKLGIHEIMEIAYYWLAELTHKSITMVTGHSSKTITAFMSYLRQLVASGLEIDDLIIGGQDIVVEVDESKFGKRKYNRGHMVEGAWILGGVERTPERRVFLVEVPDRKAETLLYILSRYIREGSIIYTDCFSSYSGLHELFEHHTVNHSENFVDPETGCHTNTIEGTWCGIKMKIAPRNRVHDLIDLHLAEFQWRRANDSLLWDSLIYCLKDVKYIRE
jgi:transposase-like protein